MHRMGEAKGAVELLLADCYSRRDSVALIAFRGQQAELLLPPTRSLTRAKKALAALPGGGGTPLAHALDLTSQLTAQIQRDGATPTVVFLTDGVANIARDGSPGRGRAGEEALAAAACFQSLNSRSLLISRITTWVMRGILVAVAGFVMYTLASTAVSMPVLVIAGLVLLLFWKGQAPVGLEPQFAGRHEGLNVLVMRQPFIDRINEMIAVHNVTPAPQGNENGSQV